MAVALYAVLAVAGCDRSEPDRPRATPDCGLPSPKRNVDATIVPEVLLLDGDAELVSAKVRRGLVSAIVNVPLAVDRTLIAYRSVVRRAGYEILQIDNEGFEGEIYLQARRKVGAITVRSSACSSASVVFLNMPSPPP